VAKRHVRFAQIPPHSEQKAKKSADDWPLTGGRKTTFDNYNAKFNW